MTRTFADTNVVLYLLSADTRKATQAESVLTVGTVLSVQVLNEIANVARRKIGMPWRRLDAMLASVCALCEVAPLTVDTHEYGRALAERYSFSIYDAMIVAAALMANCDTLYSEDMHDGLLVEGRLNIQNPFK